MEMLFKIYLIYFQSMIAVKPIHTLLVCGSLREKEHWLTDIKLGKNILLSPENKDNGGKKL